MRRTRASAGRQHSRPSAPPATSWSHSRARDSRELPRHVLVCHDETLDRDTPSGRSTALCLLSGVKQTSPNRAAMSANDPKRTSRDPFATSRCCRLVACGFPPSTTSPRTRAARSRASARESTVQLPKVTRSFCLPPLRGRYRNVQEPAPLAATLKQRPGVWMSQYSIRPDVGGLMPLMNCAVRLIDGTCSLPLSAHRSARGLMGGSGFRNSVNHGPREMK